MRSTAVRALAGGLVVILCSVVCQLPPAVAQQPQAPAPPQDPSGTQQPGYAITVSVPLVNVDVVVTDNNGNYLSGLKKDNFRILEDGVPQTVTNFDSGQGPFTIVLLAEYSKLAYGYFLYTARNWAFAFLRQIKPQDWIALVSFDTRPHIEVDFTHNPDEIARGLAGMTLPFFTESELYDAVLDTLDRMQGVKGRKAILVLASGIDTFSRANLNTVLDRLKENDTAIFCVGVGERAYMTSPGDLTYLQAQNQLRTFASMSGRGGPGFLCLTRTFPASCRMSPPVCATNTVWRTRPATLRRTVNSARSRWSCWTRTVSRW